MYDEETDDKSFVPVQPLSIPRPNERGIYCDNGCRGWSRTIITRSKVWCPAAERPYNANTRKLVCTYMADALPAELYTETRIIGIEPVTLCLIF